MKRLELGRRAAVAAVLAWGVGGFGQDALAQAQSPAGPAPSVRSPAKPLVPPAEAQLQAIRTALIEKAMGSNTRVSSTAWINEQGELMEASQFRSDMQVRGVRVMEYVDGDAPDAVVQVSDTSTPSLNRAAPECRDAADVREPWRHPLAFRLVVDRPLDPRWATLSAQAGRWLDAAVRQSAQADAVMLDTFVASPARNRYEDALWSFPQPRSTMVITVRVRLQEGWEPEQPGARRHRWEAQAREWLEWQAPTRRPMTIRLDWSLARTGEAPLHVQQARLPVMVDASGRPSLQFDDVARQRLQQEASHRWQVLQGVLDCEPLVYEARGHGDGRVLLMAGQDAGLRVGDRLLLVDGRLVPGRMLEPEAAPHLALLEIQQVQGQRAQARQVAGPRLALEHSNQWLAMPFGASLLASRQETGK